MRGSPLVVALFATMALAGCLSDEPAPETGPKKVVESVDRTPAVVGFEGLPLADLPTFSTPILIDDVRAGGEPVIAVLQSGTILISAHPGWTHYHPSDEVTHVGTEIITPANVQSYLWRSTDGGTSWSHVNLADLPIDNLPRSTALGVSDPDFTVMEDGTVCHTDLFALATSSTSCSEDDGQTWMPGNMLSAGGPNDRQWLFSDGDELYFSANFLGSPDGSRHVRASADKGITWEARGNRPCNQDPLAHEGIIYQACGSGISVSTDGGRTFSEVRRPENATGGARMPEPGIDAAGNVWVTYSEGERRLYVAGTPDHGETWPWRIELTPHFRLFSQQTDFDPGQHGGNTQMSQGTNGSYVWPWISAGSEGRIAVTWIGGFSETPSSAYNDPWYLFTAYVINATHPTPTVVVQPMTPTPIHFGPICQGGTACQISSMAGQDSGDRRLGDFFETTIDAEGFLHATVSDTFTARQDVISHPAYVRQTGGIRLLADEDIGVFMPTQG